MKRLFFIFTVTMMLFTGAAWAQGGPPLVTDDPGTPGNGNWELNTAAQFLIAREATLYASPVLDANYGYGNHIQLNLVAGWNSTLDRETNTTTRGMSGISTAVKWRFIDEEQFGVAISTYPRIDSKLPISSKDPTVNDPGTRYFLPIEFSKAFGKVGINPEIGYSYATRMSEEWDYGVAFSYEFEKDREGLAEIHYRSQLGRRRPEALYNFGTRYAFNEGISFIGAIGHSFSNFEGESPFYNLYLGAQIRL